jgi:hypothetical protein
MDKRDDPLGLDPVALRRAAQEYRVRGQYHRQESLKCMRLAEISAELADVLSGDVPPEKLRQSLILAEARRRNLAREQEAGAAKQSASKYGPAVLNHPAKPNEKLALPPLKPDWLAEMTYADAAYEILKFMGHPMSAAELREALEKGGKPVKGGQPASTLATSLRRDERFRKIEDGVYALQEEETIATK